MQSAAADAAIFLSAPVPGRRGAGRHAPQSATRLRTGMATADAATASCCRVSTGQYRAQQRTPAGTGHARRHHRQELHRVHGDRDWCLAGRGRTGDRQSPAVGRKSWRSATMPRQRWYLPMPERGGLCAMPSWSERRASLRSVRNSRTGWRRPGRQVICSGGRVG